MLDAAWKLVGFGGAKFWLTHVKESLDGMNDENIQANVFVGNCRYGNGVFAARRFLPREEILRFQGPEIDLSIVLTKGDHASDPLQIGIDRYLDLEPPGKLVNHSCKPNAGISQNNTLIAIKEISQGEEIFYDYSTTMGDGGWTMDCLCGEQNCRGTITDFRHLPPPLQKSYLEAGIVQSYLVEELMRVEAPEINDLKEKQH